MLYITYPSVKYTLKNKGPKVHGFLFFVKFIIQRYTNTENMKDTYVSTHIIFKVMFKIYFKTYQRGASLVAQRLRACLPMQGTRVRALVWEDPTCRGATRPVSHNY